MVTFGRSVRVTILLTALALGLLVTASVASAAASKFSLIIDVADGSGEVRDTSGPAGGGFVNFNVDGQGNLRITGALKKVEANQEYDVVVWCNPTHATATAALFVGSVTTNAAGNANTGAIHIDAQTLADDCSTGVVHIDFDAPFPDTGTYVGTPIEY